jgi:hypothetical protein
LRHSPALTFLPSECPVYSFTPALQAQEYVRGLASAIAELDGSPVHLCDDGESGTSHNFICDVEDFVRENETLAGSPLEPVLELCERRRAVLRVWWADNDADAYLRAPSARDRTELLHLLLTQSDFPGWVVRYRPGSSSDEGRLSPNGADAPSGPRHQVAASRTPAGS